MNKLFVIGLVVLVLSITSVSSLTINYFYSPTCPHCNQVKPLVESLYNKFNTHTWNLHDTSTTSYDVPGVPTARIKTSDCREIELVGSDEISKYLKCEVQEMSTKECPTNLKLNRGSYFIN